MRLSTTYDFTDAVEVREYPKCSLLFDERDVNLVTIEECAPDEDFEIVLAQLEI